MEKTKIAWTEFTWNPWQGCHKVSEGCKFCYMFRDKERYGQDPNTVVKSSKTTFEKPLKIKEPSMIFTCSWSDFFIEEADEWRDEAWDIIEKTPQHTYQILTKRPDRVYRHLPKKTLNNVWIGVSIENNKHSDRANLALLEYLTFASFEPLLEKIEWQQPFEHFDWVILGAESGNETGKYKYRDCDIEWIRDLAYKFDDIEIPVFIKQIRMNNKLITDPELFPDDLKQFRQFPK